jgi:hypothetical protein
MAQSGKPKATNDSSTHRLFCMLLRSIGNFTNGY